MQPHLLIFHYVSALSSISVEERMVLLEFCVVCLSRKGAEGFCEQVIVAAICSDFAKLTPEMAHAHFFSESACPICAEGLRKVRGRFAHQVLAQATKAQKLAFNYARKYCKKRVRKDRGRF